MSIEKNISHAIQEAFDEGETVILEGFLDGTEVTCGVYKSKNGVESLPITEIVSENDFFDFEAKYKGLSQEITPARNRRCHDEGSSKNFQRNLLINEFKIDCSN